MPSKAALLFKPQAIGDMPRRRRKAAKAAGRPPAKFIHGLYRTHLKKRILVPDQGEADFQTAGIRLYVEDLKEGFNAELGPKDFFEIGFSVVSRKNLE